eukprot:480647_1
MCSVLDTRLFIFDTSGTLPMMLMIRVLQFSKSLYLWNMEVKDWEQVNDTLIFEYWFIAIFIHIFGTIVSCSQWCIETNPSKKPNCGVALATYCLGTTITKLSYGFGPIALLLPLESLVVVWNALFESKSTRRDRSLNKRQVIGMIMILFALTMIIIFGPRSNTSYYTIEDLLFRFNESSSVFIILLMSLFVLTNWLIFTIQCKHKTDEFYMLTFVHISSYFGAWNIVFTKCILQLMLCSLISLELASMNWTHWLSYIVVIAFILSLIGCENWKQRALHEYRREYVIGSYTFLLIVIGIILGSMLFDEFTEMALLYLVVYLMAILVLFVGIGIVSFEFKEQQTHAREPLQETAKTGDVIYDMMGEGEDREDEEDQLNWQRIGQILMDHAFIESVEATNACLDQLEDFLEEEDILCDEFGDALCASYCNINDEGSILWQVLFSTLNYATQRRLRFYDLVLHEYFTLADMNVSNIVQILSKMTRELSVPRAEFCKIKEIVLNKKLNGHKFESMDCTEFILLFRSIRCVDASVWSLIYEELMYWSYQEFEANHQIDWEGIGRILWQNSFGADQDELNACLDEFELYFEKEQLSANRFTHELCLCYAQDTDKGSIMRNILCSIMHYSAQKRLQFYDIVLHKCMHLESLNTVQMITVLKRSVRTVDTTIDLNKFESIAKLHKLNGTDMAGLSHAEQFAQIFESLHHEECDANTWERIYEVEMLKWQQYTPTEYEYSVSRTATKTLIKDRTTKYVQIPNEASEHEDDEASEIANALIDILEDVAWSQEPYIPSKHSRSRSKRRRPSTAHQVFPRERRARARRKRRRRRRKTHQYLKFVAQSAPQFGDKHLLSHIIDAYDLTRLDHKDIVTAAQFIQTYPHFGEVEEYIVHKHNLHTQCANAGDLIGKILEQYHVSFGDEISFAPAIQIMDSMPAFMSYTCSMSNAIHRYMSGASGVCPLVVDLWIIPNKTIRLEDSIHNDIGDIQRRLRCNKLRYVKECISPSDVHQTSHDMEQCIRKNKNANRLVFVIDRRYQNTDYLYCFVPPSKHYLLPSTAPSDNNCIGASDNCNGYMFALSFVMYKYLTKIYFYSQGGKIRFLPTQMVHLWPKYFVNHKHEIDITKCVQNLFDLDVSDPYFVNNKKQRIDLPKQFVMKRDEDGRDECIQYLKECASYNSCKTLCQSNINTVLSRHQLPSTSSTNTTVA